MPLLSENELFGKRGFILAYWTKRIATGLCPNARYEGISERAASGTK